MIPFLASIPGEPEDDNQVRHYEDLEGAAPTNQYLTKKDFKKIVIGLVVVGIFCLPLFKKLKDDRDRYLCGQNIHAISLSMGIYEANNDDRFPPTYVPDTETGFARVDAKGRPYVWASTLVNMAGFDAKRSFVCPAADPSEIMVAEGEGGADLPMTYGMYQAYNAQRQASALDPGATVVIAETASGGAGGTFDPHPMPATGGKVRDGFLIGWDSGDYTFPTGRQVPPVTRLAIHGSESGLKPTLTSARHDKSIFVMFADGHYELLSAAKLSSPRYWSLPR